MCEVKFSDTTTLDLVTHSRDDFSLRRAFRFHFERKISIGKRCGVRKHCGHRDSDGWVVQDHRKMEMLFVCFEILNFTSYEEVFNLFCNFFKYVYVDMLQLQVLNDRKIIETG